MSGAILVIVGDVFIVVIGVVVRISEKGTAVGVAVGAVVTTFTIDCVVVGTYSLLVRTSSLLVRATCRRALTKK